METPDVIHIWEEVNSLKRYYILISSTRMPTPLLVGENLITCLH
jgi:hypothetical protein